MRQTEQEGSSSRVRYQPLPNTVIDLHSHGAMGAGFSQTDDEDEQGLRIYGVVGRFDQDALQMSLRVGAYAYFAPVLWPELSAEGRQGSVSYRGVAKCFLWLIGI